jgi:hypothetical protein
LPFWNYQGHRPKRANAGAGGDGQDAGGIDRDQQGAETDEQELLRKGSIRRRLVVDPFTVRLLMLVRVRCIARRALRRGRRKHGVVDRTGIFNGGIAIGDGRKR